MKAGMNRISLCIVYRRLSKYIFYDPEEEFTMAKYIMALDAGTTSNRCILFNEAGEM